MTAINPLPPLKDLEEHFRYSPYTGELKNWYSGNIAKRLDSKGIYIQVDFQNKVWQAHRICYYLGTKENPGILQVDHKDRCTTNNRLENLRLRTNSEQQHNTKIRSNCKSGHRGVIFDKKGNKWRAYIADPEKKGGKKFVYRGDSKDEAVKAREDAEKKYYPDIYQ
tara:strand:- start:37 stop:534 length:498 start_codon:yes stop_codon:yes gene_type:complete